MNLPSSDRDPLMAPVSQGEVNDKLQQRRRGVFGRLFTVAVSGIWGRGAVNSVDAEYATHDVLADKDRANKPVEGVAPQDYFRVDTQVAPPLIGTAPAVERVPRSVVVGGVVRAPSVRPEQPPQVPPQPSGNDFFRQ